MRLLILTILTVSINDTGLEIHRTSIHTKNELVDMDPYCQGKETMRLMGKKNA